MPVLSPFQGAFKGNEMNKHMNPASTRARLLATTLFAGVATLAAPAGLAIVASLAATSASAQDYTSGTLSGTVVDSSGSPIAGASVTVKSVAQGVTRTFTSGSDGAFRMPLVSPGQYNVSVSKSGFTASPDKKVSVSAGNVSTYEFPLRAEGEVSEVVITGTVNPQLDFSETTKGISIDLQEMVERMPVARDLTSVTQLAPSVITGQSRADDNFGKQPSIGGGSVAENAFYVNGLNITNFNTYVGGAEVPFDFYKSVEVKTGGYSAEFGRATGGVVSAVSKSGTNEFHAALHANLEFDGLREDSPDTYIRANHRRETEDKSYTAEFSGPIIKDRLFFYLLGQTRDRESTVATKTTGDIVTDTTNDPIFAGKLDAYITPEHHLEFTYFNTRKQTDRSAKAYSGSTDTIGAALPGTVFQDGGENWVARYTGNFTDWFTLSAAYGVSRERDNTLPTDTISPRVQDDSTGALVTVSSQKAGSSEVLSTERKFYRVDGDIYFQLAGEHHVRVGYDHEDTTLFHLTKATGGISYTYHLADADTYLVPDGIEYVEVSTQRLGGAAVDGENSSWYVQDAWDVTPNLNIQLGLRNDTFKLGNLIGQEVLDLKNNWGPRIGVNWDPLGNGNDKLFFSYGRYFIPPASNLSYRGADLGYSAFFYAPGYVVGSPTSPVFTRNSTTQVPTALGTQITDTTNPGTDPGTFAFCPQTVVAGSPSVLGCTVSFGVGVAEPAASKVAQGLDATYEDEFVVGYERHVNDLWTLNASLTYRKLGGVSEDMTLDPYVADYCDAHLVGAANDACHTVYNGSWQYIVFNPGRDLTINLRPADARVHDAATIAALAALPKTLTFSSDTLGFPEAKRRYLGLELGFNRAFDGKWGLQGSYVLSKSDGNYEGTVLSDNGQDDAGSTILFDFAGLADNQFGLLPNHRAHQFKVYGSYALTDNLTFGANLSVVSPKHLGCLGVHPTDGNASAYGASSRFCRGDIFGQAASPKLPIARGSTQETDWVKRLDLSVRYTVPTTISTYGDLVLRADIFNVLNSKGISDREERGETGSGARRPTYGLPVGYQTPRYVRVGFDWNF
jgi:outer membrane receptor protein involved in Fe transport